MLKGMPHYIKGHIK